MSQPRWASPESRPTNGSAAGGPKARRACTTASAGPARHRTAGPDWLDMAGFTKHVSTYGFRLTFAESHWTEHDTLIEHLTHPVCGFALKEDMRTCTCAFAQRGCRTGSTAPNMRPEDSTCSLSPIKGTARSPSTTRLSPTRAARVRRSCGSPGAPRGCGGVCIPDAMVDTARLRSCGAWPKDVERNTRTEGGRPDDSGRARPQGLSSASDAPSVAGHAKPCPMGQLSDRPGCPWRRVVWRKAFRSAVSVGVSGVGCPAARA